MPVIGGGFRFSAYTYNDRGQPTSVKSWHCAKFNPTPDENPEPAEYFFRTMYYDATGEFLQTEGDPRSDSISTDYSYDNTKGLLMMSSSPVGTITSYAYNPHNDLVTSVTAWDGDKEYSVLYGYNGNRQLISITHNGFDYGFTYDGMGRTKSVTIGGTTYTESAYALSDTTTVTTTYASGEKMTVETDRHQQPVKRTYTDSDGNITVMAEGEYDSLGKPTKVVDKVANLEYTYTYDGFDNVTEEKHNGETFKQYEYDSHNRLSKTTITVDGTTQVYKPIYDGSSYDNTVLGITHEGVYTSYAPRDDHNRPVEKTLTLADNTKLLSEVYGYLSVDEGESKRLTSMVETLTRKVNGTTKDTLTYTYDNNGNITEVKSNGSTVARYTYDGMNQLVREDNAILNRTHAYTYDTAGNILEKKEYPYTVSALVSPLSTKTYTYANTGWKDLLTSFDGQPITYDALGNPTVYRGHNLTWGKGKQLQSYDDHTFAYDASGMRIRKDSITYEYDGKNLLREVRPTGTIQYLYDASSICGFNYGGNNYYYQKNLQGDVTGIYDANGNLKAEYIYDAWGKCTITVDVDSIGTLNPIRYRGYYYDSETGLYYVSSRYYDPEVGRWVNADTTDILTAALMGLTDKNLFVYCDNNPVMRADHGGDFWHIVVGAAVGAVAGIVGQVISDVVTSLLNGEVTISNWQTYTGAAVGGAAGGVVLATTRKINAANAVTGAVTTGVGQSLEKLTISNYNKSWAEIGANALVDGAVSYGLGKIPGIKGATAGRNSWSAVYKSGLTKLRNGTAARMSAKVVAKGLGASIVGGFALDGYYGVKQYAYDRVKLFLV